MSPADDWDCGHKTETDSVELECGRTVNDESKKCVFHRPQRDKSDEEIIEEFVNEIEDAPNGRPVVSKEKRPCFAGAKFGSIDLENTQLAANCSFPLDLREVSARKISLKSSEVVRTLDLSGSNVEGDVVVENSVFDSELICDKINISGSLDLSKAEFDRPVSLVDVTVDGDLIMDGATFHNGINCNQVDVGGNLSLKEAEFGDKVSFKRAEIFGNVSMSNATFREGICIYDAELAELGGFDEVVDFSGADIYGPVTIADSDIHNPLQLKDIHLDDRLAIEDSNIVGDIIIKSSNLEDVDIKNVKVSVLKIDSSNTHDVRLFNLEAESIEFVQTPIEGELHLESAEINGYILIKEIMSNQQVELSDVTVGGRLQILGSRFNARVKCERLTIGEPLSADNTRFESEFIIEKGEPGSEINLREVTFDGKLKLRNFIVNEISLSDAQVRGGCSLEDLILENDSLRLQDADFLSSCSLERVRVINRIDASGVRFTESLSIKGGRARIGISLAEATIEEELLIEDVETPGAKAIELDLAGADIASGKIKRTGGSLYDTDLTRTKIGDVSFGSNDGELYGHLRCQGTQFSGFEFSDYQAELKQEEWKIHDPVIDDTIPTVEQSPPIDSAIFRAIWFFVGPINSMYKTMTAGRKLAANEEKSVKKTDSEREGDESRKDGKDHQDLARDSRNHVMDDPRLGDEKTFTPPATRYDVEDLQTTYLKAKNGANQVGAKKIASEFFRREMHYRQILHAAEQSDSRFLGWVRWFENAALRLTAGYGERPLRAIGSLMITIFAFALIYLLVQPESIDGPLDALLVSIGSFATMIFSTTPQLSSQFGQTIAMVEGVFGAIFAALLVFTLTRSVHR